MADPQYLLKVKASGDEHGTIVGAAWPTKTGGGINIRLKPGINIGGPGLDIVLWPFERKDDRPADGSGGHTGGGRW